MSTSPMMRQYAAAKQACGQALLLFRMGDFYELFHDDAVTASKVLGLTLTSRDKSESAIPMAGFPYHQLDSYLGKLINAGHRVAICEQVEDPKTAKGLVKREVTRVVTPGTLTEDALLDPRASNYLAMVVGEAARGDDPRLVAGDIGVAWLELSTGNFFAGRIPAARLIDHLSRIGPREILCIEESPLERVLAPEPWLVTTRAAWTAARERAESGLQSHFGTQTLEGFGFDAVEDALAIRAAGGILEYLKETQKSSLDHLDALRRYRAGESLEIDRATWRSLEIARTIRDNARQGSLLSVIDHCLTPGGSRKLAHWFAEAPRDPNAIRGRHDAIEELLLHPARRTELRRQLGQVFDLERLLARVITDRASPRDLVAIGKSLAVLPPIQALLAQCTSTVISELAAGLDLLPAIREQLQRALAEPPPLSVREGGIFQAGYHAELDELRELAAGGKKWIAAYQQQIQQATGISSLKIGFNKVFGYYIEATHTHRDKLPDNFIRKQTLKNAERFITPELKEYEDKVLSAEGNAQQLEYDLYCQLRDEVRRVAGPLKANAEILAVMDVVAGLAELAEKHRYCRPTIRDDQQLQIVGGRHPVLDVLEPSGTFVPNDTVLDDEHGWMQLITGPNMSGKSTYIRQVALIALMAQAGSFVPASSCELGVVDRIFARIGASDELSRGQSTFMVEMTESARILNTATARSLVILDEIGRGTSTYDGVSLAWAIVEYLHDQVGCRTLFATHYHELTELEKSLEGARNYNVAIKQWNDEIVFLHKIVPGATNKSWGIHVARLAGIPAWVQQRAERILQKLENEQGPASSPDVQRAAGAISSQPIQLTLFDYAPHPLLEKIQHFDTNRETPLRALQTIEAWKQELDQER